MMESYLVMMNSKLFLGLTDELPLFGGFEVEE